MIFIAQKNTMQLSTIRWPQWSNPGSWSDLPKQEQYTQSEVWQQEKSDEDVYKAVEACP